MISKRYDPSETESKWYSHWEDKKYFKSTPDNREPFTIVIPPPNVTGVLHMGHMLNNTIQDCLIRKARLEGKNACWVPGTDHASIATEAKVVHMLREKGIKKSDLTRDEFMEYAWQWKEEYGGKILGQLKKLGASCDWDRTRFTMEEKLSDAVIKVFVDLHKKGKIYRGLRMVNWDPKALTVLSNEEVLYKEEDSKLYHVRYQIEGTDEYVTIATTRPETILGDSAIAVHPKDERYTHLKGKKAIVPLVNRSIPIIFDDYVDREFGTGALKVTPAHDTNDYEIGKRHNLEVIEILNDDATLNEKAQFFIGETRFIARKLIVPELEASGNLVEIEDYKNNVGRSERTNSVVEPKLSLQWYVDMKSLAEPALNNVMNDNVEFFPKKLKNTYNYWMENIREWCISRQLWWGQRIPAYFIGEEVFVEETAEKALEAARAKLNNPDLQLTDLKQDEDVLDTWFSSWLWPISVFDGFESKAELDYYYPTNVLVTGPDIIFFWVARMIMAGYEWQNERPFHKVYFTGLVRDKKRRKMSKSLGNSPDALELISKFGADGVRFGMLSCSPAGGDLLFDEKLCQLGSNFSNKFWNALRLLKGWEITDEAESDTTRNCNKWAHDWINHKLNKTLADIEKDFTEFRLSEALMTIRALIWDDFCSIYLEAIKPAYEKPIGRGIYNQTVEVFSKLMTLLHPFMPFVTEEVWHLLKERKEGEDCIVSSWITGEQYDEVMLSDMELIKSVVSSVRDIRQKNSLSPNDALPLFALSSDKVSVLLAKPGVAETIKKLANISTVEITTEEADNATSFIGGAEKFFTIFEKEIDIEAEKERIEGELKRAQGFLIGVRKKLSNERFVSGAPAAVVEMERQKMRDGEQRVKILEESLESLMN